MAPKTRAEIQKAYRERKLQIEGVTKAKSRKVGLRSKRNTGKGKSRLIVKHS